MTDRAGHSATSVILSLVTSAILLATSVVPPQVQAGEGQIIILRKVPSRPATRPGVPAPPLAVKTAPPVDVSPVKEIGQAITVGIGEGVLLTDFEAATISANAPLQRGIEGGVSGLGEQISRAAGGRSRLSSGAGTVLSPIGALQGLGSSTSSQFRAAGGMITGATSGLGNTIRSAVAPQ